MEIKDLLQKYGVVFGKRMKLNQKQSFFDAISKDFGKIGYKVELQSKADKTTSINNILIGNVREADYIFMTSYDTPSKTLIPSYKFYPFDNGKTLKEETKQLMIAILLVLLLVAMLFFSLKGFNESSGFGRILRCIVIVIGAFFVFKLSVNRENIINMNKNSAAVVAIIKLAELLKGENVAFVLLDENSVSYKGIDFAKEIISQKQKVIYLDSLGSGIQMVMAVNDSGMKKDLKNVIDAVDGLVLDGQQKNNSLLGFFKNMAYFATGTILDGDFIVFPSRSRYDCDVDENRLRLFITEIVKAIK